MGIGFLWSTRGIYLDDLLFKMSFHKLIDFSSSVGSFHDSSDKRGKTDTGSISGVLLLHLYRLDDSPAVTEKTLVNNLSFLSRKRKKQTI